MSAVIPLAAYLLQSKSKLRCERVIRRVLQQHMLSEAPPIVAVRLGCSVEKASELIARYLHVTKFD